ncbi:MAG TPA: hypothetical protein DCL61_19670, partial [Cyanobacteria bacterium UBA12227]|nr:hypothetical protein [Cyanobacteria bacterium UBA12227]
AADLAADWVTDVTDGLWVFVVFVRCLRVVDQGQVLAADWVTDVTDGLWVLSSIPPSPHLPLSP